MDDAVAVMRDGRGTQFDPEIVDVLLDNLDEALAIRSVAAANGHSSNQAN
jgi:HD-GYP domain-containing protein (c-di-GMP phosphodiesterase class II)